MSEIADLWVKLSLQSKGFTEGLAKSSAEAEGFTGRVSKIGEGLATVAKAGGVAFAGVAVASVKMAMDFQRQMEMLSTQAGVPQKEIAGLSKGVLGLAGQVGFSPTSLAEALFHVESSFASIGITGPQAMSLLKTAAEGAKVGGANLVDVTNALDAAIASGIPGVQDFNQAMGVLNATVGAGDMTMQDLANAFSTGVLATVKGYGLSITDVGAALATFGDNNIRGAVAATDLRMAVQAMAVPAKAGRDTLEGLGMTMHTMAEDMQRGGLLAGLEDLKKHMDAAGVSAKQQGEILTQIFGKKAGVGVAVLYDQLDRLKSKYPDLTAAANNFGSAWEQTQKTLKVQFDKIVAGVESVGVRFGTWLMPKIEDFISFVEHDVAPVLKRFETNVRQALDSPAVHQAEQVLAGVFADVVRFLKDATTAGLNLWQAIQPVATLIAGSFLVALKAAGQILSSVVGPALREVTGFLKDNAGAVKVIAEVVLPALIARLLVFKTIDAFTSLVKGIDTAATGIQNFAKAVASGKIFDELRLKAMYAGDAVKNLGTKTAAAATEAQAASGAAGIGGLAGKIGLLVGGGALIGGAVVGMAVLGSWIDKLGKKSIDSTAELNKMTGEMLNIASSGSAANSQLAEFAIVATKNSTFKDLFKSIDDTLAQMVQSGNLKQAQAGIALIDDQLKAAGLSKDKFHDALTKYSDAAGAFVNQQREAALSAQGTTAALDVGTTALTANSGALTTNTGTLDASTSATDALANSTSNLAQQQQDMSKGLNADRALDDYNRAVQNLNKSLQDNGQSLTGMSDAAKGNRDALRQAVQSIIDNYNAQVQLSGDTKDATQKLRDQITQLENQKGMSKQTKDAIKAYVDQLNLIPPTKNTAITADTSAATANINDLQKKLSFLDQHQSGTGSTPPGSVGGRTPLGFDHGGPVPGPKGAPMLAIVHGGEYVLSNDMLDSGGRGGAGIANGAAVNYYTTVNVQGSVLAERDLRDIVEAQMLQNGGRRPKTYAPYQR